MTMVMMETMAVSRRCRVDGSWSSGGLLRDETVGMVDGVCVTAETLPVDPLGMRRDARG